MTWDDFVESVVLIDDLFFCVYQDDVEEENTLVIGFTFYDQGRECFVELKVTQTSEEAGFLYISERNCKCSNNAHVLCAIKKICDIVNA